jgi:hypothetical protein
MCGRKLKEWRQEAYNTTMFMRFIKICGLSEILAGQT